MTKPIFYRLMIFDPEFLFPKQKTIVATKTKKPKQPPETKIFDKKDLPILSGGHFFLVPVLHQKRRIKALKLITGLVSRVGQVRYDAGQQRSAILIYSNVQSNGAPSAVDVATGPGCQPAAFYTAQKKIIYENGTFFVRGKYCPLTVCLHLMEPYLFQLRGTCSFPDHFQLSNLNTATLKAFTMDGATLSTNQGNFAAAPSNSINIILITILKGMLLSKKKTFFPRCPLGVWIGPLQLD